MTSPETNNCQPTGGWLWWEEAGGMQGADPMMLVTETHRVWGSPRRPGGRASVCTSHLRTPRQVRDLAHSHLQFKYNSMPSVAFNPRTKGFQSVPHLWEGRPNSPTPDIMLSPHTPHREGITRKPGVLGPGSGGARPKAYRLAPASCQPLRPEPAISCSFAHCDARRIPHTWLL